MYPLFNESSVITKEEWRKKALPDSIKQHWNDPDGLYKDIVTALRDGFFPDIMKASERLLEIDKNKEESYIVRGIVLMKNGKLKDAKAILQSYIDKNGENGYVLTNLAKVYAEEGNHAKAEEILWKGLQVDPNQDNALDWWLALKNEKGGKAAYMTELNKIANIIGSWRAQLWLAREFLAEKDFPAARKYYDYVISKAKDAPGVLIMISGDLGKAGYYDEVFNVILPIYEPKKHDAYVGLNILNAYLESKKFEEGKKFLKQMFSLDRPDLHKNLMFYSDKFDENLSSLPKKIEDEQKISVGIVAIDKPIFYYGLKGAEWFLPETKRDGPKVGFMPLANLGINIENKKIVQQEDDVGRLTRSIPLYVSENLFFETNSYAQTLMPVVMGGGMVTSGTEYDVNYFLDAAAKSKDKQEFDFYITGTIEELNNKFNIVLSIWDCKTKEKIRSISQKRPKQEIGKAVKDLVNELVVFMEGKKGFSKVKPINYYKLLDDNLVGTQLLIYGQAFVLVLVDNNYIPKNVITGEREILRNPLDLALAAPNDLIPKLLFISNLAKAHSYHSDVCEEFRQYALKLIDDTKNDEYIVKLSPLIYKIFGRNIEFENFEKGIAKYSESYKNWFAKIKTIS